MTSHQKVAEAFANGAISGKASNMFIEGDLLYSYGYHFVIAQRTELKFKGQRVVLFNSRGYSSSTARHKLRARQALEGFFILEVFNADAKNANDQYMQNNAEIQKLIGMKQRARTETGRNICARSILNLEEQNAALVKLFGVTA